MLKHSAVLAAILLAFPAQAAIVSYYLDQSDELADGINYLQVTISDENTPGDIDFTVQVLPGVFNVSDGSNFGMQSFAFNYDTGLTVAPANIAITHPVSWTISENRNFGGDFGRFEFQLDGTGGSRTELLNFSITGVAGDSVDSYALGSSLNPVAVEYFAAFVTDFDITNGVTGARFAGSTPVPLPATIFLFGPGLLGLSAAMRRHRTPFRFADPKRRPE